MKITYIVTYLAETIFSDITFRLRWQRHECEYTGSKKHEFAGISMAAVHTDTSSVRVRVTCEFHSYEQLLRRSCYCPTRMKWTTLNLYSLNLYRPWHSCGWSLY